jgi:6,7-dimethyl-8-ribityllumazine synthase
VPHVVPIEPDGRDLRIAVLTTRWYPEIVRRLEAASVQTLKAAGVEDTDIIVVEVPGAYELPLAASWLAKDGWRGARLDAIVALGCVVKGETPHHEHVARAACDGLLKVALETGVPVGLGVITADTQAQAESRSGAAGGKGGNKGAEAADAALRMAAARKALGGPRS